MRKALLTELRPHPQNGIFEATEGMIELLARDIAVRGLQEPILINRQNVIFSGHKRVAAVRLLGWTEVPVIVMSIPESDVQTLVLANTARQHVGYSTRVRIYEALSPDILRGRRASRERVEVVSRSIAVRASTVIKDLRRYRGEDREISLLEVKQAWQVKDPKIRINVVDAAGGFIVQVSSKNFHTESGPGVMKEVLQDSYNRACSTMYERSAKRYRHTGDQIRACRERLNMTQAALAQALEISQSYLAECESGMYRSAEKILERVLGVLEGAA